MGNQATRNPLKKISEANLTEAEQLQLEELLWSKDSKKFEEEFKLFEEKYCDGMTLQEMFPVHSEFKPSDSDTIMNEDKRLLSEVIQQLTYGFTSSEYKLNQL